MRLRCSKGMRIATFHGHLFVRSNDLVALPSLSADDTIVAQMQARSPLLTLALMILTLFCDFLSVIAMFWLRCLLFLYTRRCCSFTTENVTRC